MRQTGKQPVVIAFAAPQTVAAPIEAHSGHHSHLNLLLMGKHLANRLHDVKETALQVGWRCVSAQFDVGIVQHGRQQDRLSFLNQQVENVMGIDFIRQRVIHQNRLCTMNGRTRKQALDNGLRGFLELLLAEHSFQHADMLSDLGF